LLQALPLPLRWLEILAPSQWDIWTRALKPLGSPPPELASLSLAPHRTLVEALKMASYGVIFYVSARLGRHGMGRIAAVAFASALAVALVALGHRALGAERLFGVYTPSDAQTVAPLLNPNSRAGYELLGFFCGLGLLFRFGTGPRGAFVGLGLVMIVVEILLCQSRGGTACLVFGMLLVPLLRPGAAEPPSKRGVAEMSRGWQAAIVGAIAAGAAAMAMVSRPKGGFGFEDSLDKLALFARVAELVRDHFAWGVGRGAFGSAFAPYQPGAGTIVFEHAENLPLQWAAEWGVPVTVLALAALAWSLAPIVSRRSLASPVRRCALVGAVALLAQNLVDLGLEITAIAALLAFVLGGLLGVSLGPAAPSSEHRSRLSSFGVALTATCIVLVVASGSDSPARERERLHARLAAARGAPDERFWGALRVALLSYPADPYFPLLGAAAALAEGRDSLAWAARAIERAPGSAPAQLALARALYARRATDQALGALARAIELDPETAPRAIRLGLEWRLSPELLARAVPAGPRGMAALEALAEASPPGSAERLHWLERALSRDPASPSSNYRIALELQRDVQRGEAGATCSERRDDCLRRALGHVAVAMERPSAPAAVLQAQLLALSASPRVAEEQLARGCASFRGDEECARALFLLALENRSERLPEAVRAWLAAGCSSRQRCAATHASLGDQYAARAQWHDAQNHFRQATLQWPTAGYWRSFANASKQLGQSERAEDALRRAALLEPAKNGAQ
jgi:tetratricopeptide (TPR) repeat protein